MKIDEKPDVPFDIGDVIYAPSQPERKVKVHSWEVFEVIGERRKFQPNFEDVAKGWGRWKRDEVSRVKSILNKYE